MADKKKMGLVKKLILFGGVGFIGLIAVGFAGLYFGSQSALGKTYEIEVVAIDIPEGDADAIERGKYLVNHVMGCAHSDCHRADMGGGAVINEQPVGRVYAPNITAGKGSAVVGYEAKDWVRTVRHGLKRDGTRAFIMPSEDYWVFPDSDIGSVVAYIKSLPNVDRENEGHSLGPIGMLMAATQPVFAWDKIDHQKERPKAQPGPTQEWGQVLAGACAGCHGEGLSGGKIPGGDPSWPESRNITPDEATGLGKWEFANFENAIRKGQRPDGTTLHEAMPYSLYKGMSDDDVQALWKYLQTVPVKPAGGR